MTARLCLSVSTLSILVTGCGEKIPDPVPTPQTIFLQYGNPNGDPGRCSCAGSRSAFLVNKANVAKQVSWQEARRDRISGQNYTPQPGTTNLPPTGMGEGQFIGCSIDAPTTSCRFDVNYEITSRRSLLSVQKGLVSTLGTRVAASASSCQAICSSPTSGSDGSCLPLGVRNYQAVAPVRAMFDTAIASNDDIRKNDVLAKLGLQPGDDKCERGDVKNDHGLLSNTGPSACRFRSRDLPAAALRAVGIAKTPATQSGMSVMLPKFAAYRVSAPARSVGLIAEQQRDDTSPIVVFDGAGADKLNRYYGGPIQSMSRISVAGRPPQTVLQTANGCIAVDEKVR